MDLSAEMSSANLGTTYAVWKLMFGGGQNFNWKSFAVGNYFIYEYIEFIKENRITGSAAYFVLSRL